MLCVYFMDALRTLYGHSTDTLRTLYGRSTDALWMLYGYLIDAQRKLYGCFMNALRIQMPHRCYSWRLYRCYADALRILCLCSMDVLQMLYEYFAYTGLMLYRCFMNALWIRISGLDREHSRNLEKQVAIIVLCSVVSSFTEAQTSLVIWW